MKHILNRLFFISAFLLFSNMYSQVEFDGCYVKTKSGEYLEIESTQAYTANFWLRSRLNSLTLREELKRIQHPKYYAVENGNLSVSKSNFKGIILKGNYSFQYVSIHPLIKKVIDGKIYFIEHNKGPIGYGGTAYMPGDKLELRQKSIGSEMYYWEPRQSLERGPYVVWLGHEFWIFRLK